MELMGAMESGDGSNGKNRNAKVDKIRNTVNYNNNGKQIHIK